MITSDAAHPIRQPTASGRRMPLSTEPDLEAAARKVLEANQNLRQQLDAYDHVIREALERVHSGMRISDVIATMPSDHATIGSEVEVIGVFEARRSLRKMLVAALLADGIQVDEIASTFSVSIDSICDFANELGIPYD